MYKLVNPLGITIEVHSPFCLEGDVFIMGPGNSYFKQVQTNEGIDGFKFTDEQYKGPLISGDEQYGTVEVLDDGFGIFVYTDIEQK